MLTMVWREFDGNWICIVYALYTHQTRLKVEVGVQLKGRRGAPGANRGRGERFLMVV